MVLGLIGGAIGAVTSLIGANKNKKAQESANAQNSQAQADANATNLQIMRETNAANERLQADANRQNRELATEANWWNLDLWNRQNAYNNPAAIRERMEQAGFNPLSAIGVGTGTAGAAAPAVAATAGASQWGAANVDAAQVAPVLVGEQFAAAGNKFGDALTQYGIDRSRATLLEQQNRELQSKLKSSVLRPRVGGVFGGGDVPHQHFGLNQSKNPAARNNAPDDWNTDPKGKAPTDEGYRAGTKDGLLSGLRWERSGLNSDGAWAEDAYGDLGGGLWGLAALGSDIGHNARRAFDHFTQRPTYHDAKKAPKRNSRYTEAQRARESSQLYNRPPKSDLEVARERANRYQRY